MKTTFNKVEICGFLGQDPRVIEMKNGNVKVTMSVATSEGYKNTKGEWINNTHWHNVVLWKAIEDSLKEKIKKGALVSIKGKLANRKYKDTKGIEHTITEIVANTLELESREQAG